MNKVENNPFVPKHDVPLLPAPKQAGGEKTKAQHPFDNVIGFGQVAVGHGAADALDERGKWVTIRYVTDENATYDSLRPFAGNVNKQRVAEIVHHHIEKLHRASPQDVQERYPLAELLLARKPRKPLSSELRAKIGEASRGRIPSVETRAKMSEAQKGRISPMKGRKHTSETRARMSEAKRGKARSLEIREILSKSHKTSPKVQEHLRRLNEARKGTKLSVEQRLKLSEAQKRRWQERRHQKLAAQGDIFIPENQ